MHDLFKDFYSKLEGAVNRHAPLKKLSPKEMKVKSKPWLNAEILKMIKIRNKVFNRKKRKPTNANSKHLYNLLRNCINRDIKKSKKQYYEQYFTEHVNNIKKTCDGIKNIVNIKKTPIELLIKVPLTPHVIKVPLTPHVIKVPLTPHVIKEAT